MVMHNFYVRTTFIHKYLSCSDR